MERLITERILPIDRTLFKDRFEIIDPILKNFFEVVLPARDGDFVGCTQWPLNKWQQFSIRLKFDYIINGLPKTEVFQAARDFREELDELNYVMNPPPALIADYYNPVIQNAEYRLVRESPIPQQNITEFVTMWRHLGRDKVLLQKLLTNLSIIGPVEIVSGLRKMLAQIKEFVGDDDYAVAVYNKGRSETFIYHCLRKLGLKKTFRIITFEDIWNGRVKDIVGFPDKIILLDDWALSGNQIDELTASILESDLSTNTITVKAFLLGMTTMAQEILQNQIPYYFVYDIPMMDQIFTQDELLLLKTYGPNSSQTGAFKQSLNSDVLCMLYLGKDAESNKHLVKIPDSFAPFSSHSIGRQMVVPANTAHIIDEETDTLPYYSSKSFL